MSVKSKPYGMCTNDYRHPSTCICENSRYLKSVDGDLVIVSNKIVNVANSVSTNITNTVPTNVTRTVSINSDYKKVRYKMDYYILHTFLLVTILLFIMAHICYHYIKYRSKQKHIWILSI